MSHFHDPIYLPGPRGRAHRRWRKLRDTVSSRTALRRRASGYPCYHCCRHAISVASDGCPELTLPGPSSPLLAFLRPQPVP